MAVFTGNTEDGKPLIGVAHAKLYKNFPEKPSFPWLLELIIEFKDVQENGMPAADELNVFEVFQDALMADLASVTTVHEVGHVTGDGAREIWCYLPEPSSANALLAMKTAKPSEFAFQFRITHDPNWSCAEDIGL